MQSLTLWTLASCLALGSAPAPRCTLSTGDGLSLELDEATGALQAVAVSGRKLPMISGVPGGLSYRQWRYVEPGAARPLAKVDFEGPQGWVALVGGNWSMKRHASAQQQADGGALGSRRYVRLGATKQFGHGVGLAEPLPVQADRAYEISWQGRAPGPGDTFIVYVRLQDAAGRDITPETPPPDGWTYSPYSNTHYRESIQAPPSGEWGRLRRIYHAPRGVAALRIAVCLWRGDHVDADELEVREAPGAQCVGVVVPSAPLVALANGIGYQQRAVIAGQQIEIQVTYRPKADHIRIEGEVRDTSDPPRDRAVEVCYNLPVQTKGWWWHDDIRRRRAVAANKAYSNDFGHAGHRVARYPLACATSAEAGLAMAVPMDYPAMQWGELSTRQGLSLSWDLGVTAQRSPPHRGRATFALTIYSVDPRWGFRSAAAGYYRIFPESFTRRAKREGCWLWPIAPGEIRRPEDFGLTFWEASAPTRALSDTAHALGLYVLTYIEPCGIRQWFSKVRDAAQLPSEAESLARLRAMAADKDSSKAWSGGPRGPQAVIAQAILNSLPETALERPLHPVSDEYGEWAKHWYTNPSPHLPMPNRGRVAWDSEIAPSLDYTDGVYVDSVSLWTIDYENSRKEHLAAAQGPLSFSRDTARPSLPAGLSYGDFLAYLADQLHGRGKLLMLNIFADPPAYRFYAHLGDVLGSEVSASWSSKARCLAQVEPDTLCCLRRTYAFRKPVANLLQEGNWNKPRPALTRQQVEQYIQHQLFYGFYPGISTIGGEEKPGYATWKRYFGSGSQCDRDRDLFQQYIPIIRRLNAAGWEPVTYASAQPAEILIERFGAWSPGGLYFTVRNSTDAPQRARVTAELLRLGIPQRDLGRLAASDLVSRRPVAVALREAEGIASAELPMEAYQTIVLHVAAEKTK